VRISRVGQNGWKRLNHPRHGYKGELFFIANVRGVAQVITVELQIKPYALGLRQEAARAIGGVFENYIGAADGGYKGLYIAPAMEQIS